MAIMVVTQYSTMHAGRIDADVVVVVEVVE